MVYTNSWLLTNIMIEHTITLIYLCKYGNISFIENHINKYKMELEISDIIQCAWKYSLYSYGKKLFSNFFHIDPLNIKYGFNIYKYGTIKQIKEITGMYPYLLHISNNNDIVSVVLRNNMIVFNWMIKNCTFDTLSTTLLFSYALYNEQLDIAKLIWNTFDVKIPYYNYKCVKHALQSQNKKIIRWLISLFDYKTSKVIFDYANKTDCIWLAKKIVYGSKYYDLTKRKHKILRKALYYNSQKIIRWLIKICDKYNYGIFDEECYVCYEQSEIKTSCNHYYCAKCQRLMIKCYYCRQSIDGVIIHKNFILSS